ncbi:hypothetical protein Ahy_B06g085965 [Arachis hypogaea]|uniref:RING-type domain-containing protein n=1 Tax=Arachis hypogaea TaxID=3818 RepID=A0A444YW50_ARAHY|nr:hypothetical protein Ahy_B06g085965 [Arachis hypogaea]
MNESLMINGNNSRRNVHRNFNGTRSPQSWSQRPCSSVNYLRGKILDLAKTQCGCRVLQDTMKGLTSKEEVSVFFQELVDHNVIELMGHSFGNYVFQKLVEICSEEQITTIVFNATKNVLKFVNLCLDIHGTRSVQKLLEHVTNQEQRLCIMSALTPRVVALSTNTNGLHVVDHCVKHFSSEDTKYMMNIVATNCFKIATDKSGCCVIQQFVDHAPVSLKIARVTKSLMKQLEGKFVSMSCNKYGSNVVEKFFQDSGESHSRSIILELLHYPNVSMLLVDPYANFVISSAIIVSKGGTREELLKVIKQHSPMMRSNHYGKKLLGRLRKFLCHKPELISQTNWTTSRFLVVPRNTRKGFSLWLNKGSRIRMRWEAQASSRNQLEGMVIKGERRFEKMVPQQTFSLDTLAIRETINEDLRFKVYGVTMIILQMLTGNEAEYMIEEDDRYQIGVLNMNDKNIVLNLNVNVSAKIYDTTKANNIYSSINGSCTFSLLFPNTYYLILTAPKNVNDYDDDSNNDEEWFVEVSFITRVIAYIAILGLCIIVIFVILRCLGGYDNDNDNSNVTIDTSNNNNNVLVSSSQEITEPMMHHHHDVKPNPKNDEEEESSEDGSSCSSEELYDEKLCVICYDEQRNCFFVPCGHSATCFPCAKRIVDGESKVCPVCRRLIHKEVKSPSNK